MKISIVLPSYNQGDFVEEALHSIFTQDYKNIEVIFIDAGSTDGTLSTVERYRNRLDVVLVEADAGQSDALRKGFDRSTGDVLTWLNTDDLLLPGVLNEVAGIFTDDSACEWVLGNVIWVDSNGIILRCRRGEAYSTFLLRAGVFSACGPSAFFSKGLYERVNGINLNLHYMMDTELWWRFVASGAKFRRLKSYTWALRLHEDAKMSGHLFSGTPDSTAGAKRLERAHVHELALNYRPFPLKGAARPIASLYRAVSANYLRSLYDTSVLKGRPISYFWGRA